MRTDPSDGQGNQSFSGSRITSPATQEILLIIPGGTCWLSLPGMLCVMRILLRQTARNPLFHCESGMVALEVYMGFILMLIII